MIWSLCCPPQMADLPSLLSQWSAPGGKVWRPTHPFLGWGVAVSEGEEGPWRDVKQMDSP